MTAKVYYRKHWSNLGKYLQNTGLKITDGRSPVMMTGQISFSLDKPRFWPVIWWRLYFFAYGISNYAGNRSSYCIDVQVFGGKLVKNSFTHFWVPFRSFHPFSRLFIYSLSIIVQRCLKSPRFIPYLYIGENWSFSLPSTWSQVSSTKKRNFAKYSRQRSWFGEKSVPQTAYLSSEVNEYIAELSFGSSRNTLSLSRTAH